MVGQKDIGIIACLANNIKLLGILMKRICIVLSVLLFALPIAAITDKILIITHAFNRPDFIEYQAKTFKKFLQDRYEFVVFNDANDPIMSEQIQNTCQQLKILCFNVPQFIQKDIEWASKRTANAIQYSLLALGFDYEGIVFIIDSDMFLIKPLSIQNFLGDYELYGARQSNGEIVYLWNGLVIMDMATLPNKETISFNCTPIRGKAVDTGGHLHYYLTNNPDIKLKTYGDIQINQLPRDSDHLKALGFDYTTCDFILNHDSSDTHGMQFHADNNFLHYRAGGNWMHKDTDYHTIKSAYLFKYLNTILQQ